MRWRECTSQERQDALLANGIPVKLGSIAKSRQISLLGLARPISLTRTSAIGSEEISFDHRSELVLADSRMFMWYTSDQSVLI